MKYTKPPLTSEQQANLLISRGLIADKDILIERLESVNYYRLSTYLYTFRLPGDTYKSVTTLDKVWKRYTFDRQLRLIVLDAIERAEVALKTQITQFFSYNHGPFGHFDKSKFDSSMSDNDYNNFISDIRGKAETSKEVFVEHFRNTYDEFPELPLWVAVEIMSFGNVFTLYRNMKNHDKRKISFKYNIAGKILESWIKSLNYTRNICAHHSRLWNRELAIRPYIPDYKNHPEWHSPEPIDNKRIFAVLSLLSYLITYVAPQSKWNERLKNLLNDYNEIPIADMGFKGNWQDYDFWK